MKPPAPAPMRATGLQGAFQAKLETLLGDRDPKSPQRAIRWGELAQALQSTVLVNLVSKIISGGIGKELGRLESELGQIVTTQSFAASYSIADGLIGANVVFDTAITIADVQISGFNAGTFTITYTGFADNLHRTNSMGVLQILVNDVEQQRIVVGIAANDVPSRFVLPVVMQAIFVQPGNTFNVKVRAWTRQPDDPSAGGGGYYVRNGKLVVQGGVN